MNGSGPERDYAELVQLFGEPAASPRPAGAGGRKSIAALRRSRRRMTDAGQSSLVLVERDGVLRWEDPGEAFLVGPRRAGLRRAGSGASSDDAGPGRVIVTRSFEQIPGNKIAEYLQGADRMLTPTQGLYRLDIVPGDLPSSKWIPVQGPVANVRTLLLVHGTFSSIDHYQKELTHPSNAPGRDFLIWAKKNYQQVLGFGHPTLSVSPMLNAVHLERLFRRVSAQVDIIAHSRGGLVTRWWLDGVGGGAVGERRAVLVGSPMSGTSLASPARVRAVMNLLTNIISGIQTAGDVLGTAIPFAQVVKVLATVAGSITSALSKLPIADAAVLMVPGLHGQSRVGNNSELLTLRSMPPRAEYFAITSNFQSDDPGWKFWQYFRKGVILDKAADIVFGDEPGLDGTSVGVQNDLVVDTSSMTQLGEDEFPKGQTYAFGTNSRVYHTNYFQQPETFAAIKGWFGDVGSGTGGGAGGGVGFTSLTSSSGAPGVKRKGAKKTAPRRTGKVVRVAKTAKKTGRSGKPSR